MQTFNQIRSKLEDQLSRFVSRNEKLILHFFDYSVEIYDEILTLTLKRKVPHIKGSANNIRKSKLLDRAKSQLGRNK